MKNKLSLKSCYRVLDVSIRKVVMFLFILSATISTAQTNKASGLTNAEFEKAKQLYLDMMQTDTYKEMHQNMIFIVNRRNRVELPQPDPSWWQYDDAKLLKLYKERVRDWAKANRKKMKFKSANEAYVAVIKGIELTQRREAENKELYTLMRQANKAQFSEIIKPEKIL